MAHSESNFFSKISFTKSGYVAKESYKIIVKALKEEHSKSLFNNKVFSTEIDSKLTAEQKIVILELIVEELFDEAAEIIKREICDTCDVLISPKHPVKVQMPNFNKVMSLECDTCETLNWTGKVFIKQDKVVNALIQDKLIKKGKKRIMFTIDDNKILSINRKVIPNHLQEKYTKFINEYLVFEIVD